MPDWEEVAAGTAAAARTAARFGPQQALAMPTARSLARAKNVSDPRGRTPRVCVAHGVHGGATVCNACDAVITFC